MKYIRINSVTFDTAPGGLGYYDISVTCNGSASADYQATNIAINSDGTLVTPLEFLFPCDISEATVTVSSTCDSADFPIEICPDILDIAMIQTLVTYTMCGDCILSFSSTSNNQIGTLSAGNLTSTNCTLGNYVIDWYRNSISGSPVFTSGNSSAADPSVTVVHPFANEPVQGGTYYPVIRFAYLNGIKYSNTEVAGARYSPDLGTCLTPITVQNLNCSNTYNADSNYSHVYTYTNSVTSPTLAARSLRFDLSADTVFFPWFFEGQSVPDTLKITYVSGVTETVLDYFETGSSNTFNIGVTPYKFNFYNIKKLLSLSAFTYQAGDYLRIDITPNATNTATNWVFKGKCLTAADCNVMDSNVRKIVDGSISFTWDSASCRWVGAYTRQANNPWNSTNSIYVKYHDINSSLNNEAGTQTISYMSYNPSSTTVTVGLPQNTQGQGYYSSGAAFTCTAASGQITYVKSNATIVATYASATDYNAAKANIATLLSDPNFTNYSADNTNINHYKYWVLYMHIGAVCGDSVSTYSYYTHYPNTPVANDSNMTITYTLSAPTNNYPITACDTTHNDLNNYISNINNNLTGSWTRTTSLKSTSSFFGIRSGTVTNASMDIRYSLQYYVYLNNACDLTTKGWQVENAAKTSFYSQRDRWVITNNADPTNNFQFYRKVKIDGTSYTNWTLLYEKIGGVVTTNLIPDYNNGII